MSLLALPHPRRRLLLLLPLALLTTLVSTAILSQQMTSPSGHSSLWHYVTASGLTALASALTSEGGECGTVYPGDANATQTGDGGHHQTLSTGGHRKGLSSGSPLDLGQQWEALSTEDGAVAVCLAGSLEMLDFTLSNLEEHLFSQYHPPHVFITAPLDEHSHKALLLSGLPPRNQSEPPSPNDTPGQDRNNSHWLARGIGFIMQRPFHEGCPGAMILEPHGSHGGVQGLLHRLLLVEECNRLISKAELKQKYKYDWVIRTRPDSFWIGPSPPLLKLDPVRYTFPEGSAWWGFNDRLGVSRRSIADKAMKRLSLLDSLAKGGWRWGRINSELSLKLHLEMMGVNSTALPFSFCVLNSHPFRTRTSPWRVPVFSVKSRAPLNGAYCRPCDPVLSGEAADASVAALHTQGGLPYNRHGGLNASGFELCNSSSPWDGSPLVRIGTGHDFLPRMRIDEAGNLSLEECTDQLRTFLESVPVYFGPSAGVLCSVRSWNVSKAQQTQHLNPLSTKIAADELDPRSFRVPSTSLGHLSVNLDHWDGKHLERLPLINTTNCKLSCIMTLHINATCSSISRNSLLVDVMKSAGWSAVKCTGTYFSQDCLFIGQIDP